MFNLESTDQIFYLSQNFKSFIPLFNTKCRYLKHHNGQIMKYKYAWNLSLPLSSVTWKVKAPSFKIQKAKDFRSPTSNIRMKTQRLQEIVTVLKKWILFTP
jgi:hypothetical protein